MLFQPVWYNDYVGLPDQQSRQAIIAQYAKQLTEPELEEVTRVTEG